MSTLVQHINTNLGSETAMSSSDGEDLNSPRSSLKRKAEDEIENLQKSAQLSSDYETFLSSASLNSDLDDFSNYIALDCEMVLTEKSANALARCTIVDFYGNILYDKFVKPYSKILDYRSRYSGVYPENMATATPFCVAQRQIRGIVSGRTVVGHTISSDFSSIGFSHPQHQLIDINRLDSVRRILGLPADSKHPVGLKRMVKALFQEDIQVGPHSSYEDAWATMRVFKLSLTPDAIKHKVVLPPPDLSLRRKSTCNSYAGRKLSDQLMAKIRSQSASGSSRTSSSSSPSNKKTKHTSISKQRTTNTESKLARRDSKETRSPRNKEPKKIKKNKEPRDISRNTEPRRSQRLMARHKSPKKAQKQKRASNQGRNNPYAGVKAKPNKGVYPISNQQRAPGINYNKYLDDKYWL